MGVVKDEPAIGPFGRAGIADCPAVDGKIRNLRGAEERGHLSVGARRSVGRPCPPRRNRKGDAAAPGKNRLIRRAAPGIGKPVPLQLLHQEEGAEHDFLPARADRRDRLDHRRIGRRPAVDRPVILADDLRSRRARDSARGPGHPLPVARCVLDLRPDLALPAAQIATEPGHDKRHRATIRQFFPQRAQRHREIRAARG